MNAELTAAIGEKLFACGVGVMFGLLGYRLLSLRLGRGEVTEGNAAPRWWEVLPGTAFGITGGVVIVVGLWHPLPERQSIADAADQPPTLPAHGRDVPPDGGLTPDAPLKRQRLRGEDAEVLDAVERPDMGPGLVTADDPFAPPAG